MNLNMKITEITDVTFRDKDGDVVLSFPWNKKREPQNVDADVKEVMKEIQYNIDEQATNIWLYHKEILKALEEGKLTSYYIDEYGTFVRTEEK